MNSENDRCPDCENGWLHGQISDCGICSVRCKTCEGTGLRDSRAGVGCAALVGVADAESEVCPGCDGEGSEETMTDWGPECAWVCETCDGTGRVRRITPTVSDDLPRKAGTRGAGKEGAE